MFFSEAEQLNQSKVHKVDSFISLLVHLVYSSVGNKFRDIFSKLGSARALG